MLRKFLNRKDLSSIVSGFNRTVTDLDDFQKRAQRDINWHSTVIDDAVAEKARLQNENDKANSISENIRKLINAA